MVYLIGTYQQPFSCLLHYLSVQNPKDADIRPRLPIAKYIGQSGVGCLTGCAPVRHQGAGFAPEPLPRDLYRQVIYRIQDVDAWKNAKSAQSVAEYGYQAMQRGELVAFNDAKLKFASDWVIPFLPRKTVLKMSRMAMEKRK